MMPRSRAGVFKDSRAVAVGNACEGNAVIRAREGSASAFRFLSRLVNSVFPVKLMKDADT